MASYLTGDAEVQGASEPHSFGNLNHQEDGGRISSIQSEMLVDVKYAQMHSVWAQECDSVNTAVEVNSNAANAAAFGPPPVTSSEGDAQITPAQVVPAVNTIERPAWAAGISVPDSRHLPAEVTDNLTGRYSTEQPPLPVPQTASASVLVPTRAPQTELPGRPVDLREEEDQQRQADPDEPVPRSLTQLAEFNRVPPTSEQQNDFVPIPPESSADVTCPAADAAQEAPIDPAPAPAAPCATQLPPVPHLVSNDGVLKATGAAPTQAESSNLGAGDRAASADSLLSGADTESKREAVSLPSGTDMENRREAASHGSLKNVDAEDIPGKTGSSEQTGAVSLTIACDPKMYRFSSDPASSQAPAKTEKDAISLTAVKAAAVGAAPPVTSEETTAAADSENLPTIGSVLLSGGRLVFRCAACPQLFCYAGRLRTHHLLQHSPESEATPSPVPVMETPQSPVTEFSQPPVGEVPPPPVIEAPQLPTREVPPPPLMEVPQPPLGVGGLLGPGPVRRRGRPRRSAAAAAAAVAVADQEEFPDAGDITYGEAEDAIPRAGRTRSGRTRPSLKMDSLKCEVCGKVLSSANKMAIHQRMHSGERPYVCSYCPKRCNDFGNLKKHEQLHFKPRPFSCATCGISFWTALRLRAHCCKMVAAPATEEDVGMVGDGQGTAPHGEAESQEGMSRLGVAELGPDRPALGGLPALAEAAELQAGTRPQRQPSPEREPNIHSGLTPVVPVDCDVCGRQLRSISGWQRHRRLHAGIRLYQCRFCDKTCNDSGNMKKHERGHFKERPYRCDTCCITFVNRWRLNMHQCKLRVADGGAPDGTVPPVPIPAAAEVEIEAVLESRPALPAPPPRGRHAPRPPLDGRGRRRDHVCNVCDKAMLSYASLLMHYRTHTGEKPYQCDECGKRFSIHGNLMVHRRIHTGERPFQCEECGKMFMYQSHLKVHKRGHSGARPYRCRFCDKGFASSSSKSVHEETVHTNERKFICEICGVAFKEKKHLKRHRLKQHQAGDVTGI